MWALIRNFLIIVGVVAFMVVALKGIAGMPANLWSLRI